MATEKVFIKDRIYQHDPFKSYMDAYKDMVNQLEQLDLVKNLNIKLYQGNKEMLYLSKDLRKLSNHGFQHYLYRDHMQEFNNDLNYAVDCYRTELILFKLNRELPLLSDTREQGQIVLDYDNGLTNIVALDNATIAKGTGSTVSRTPQPIIAICSSLSQLENIVPQEILHNIKSDVENIYNKFTQKVYVEAIKHYYLNTDNIDNTVFNNMFIKRLVDKDHTSITDKQFDLIRDDIKNYLQQIANNLPEILSTSTSTQAKFLTLDIDSKVSSKELVQKIDKLLNSTLTTERKPHEISRSF